MKEYLVVIKTTEEGCDYNLNCGTLTMWFVAESYQALIDKIHIEFGDYGPRDYWEFEIYEISDKKFLNWVEVGQKSNKHKCFDCYEVGDFKKIGDHYFCKYHASNHSEKEQKCKHCGGLTDNYEIIKGKIFCNNCFKNIFGES